MRGHEYRRLTKRINLILSDIAFQENLPSGSRASLRNAEDSVENGPTGIQEYRYLDAKDLDLDSNSVDMIVAIGLFTKFVSNVAENLTTILSEISRVLNHEGELVMTIHEDYLSWFHDSISQFQYEVVVKQCEADHSPEGDRGGARCLLVLKFGL